MTLELLSSIVGMLTSLVFSYAPKVKDWFDKLFPNQKRLVVVGVALVISAAFFGLGCANVIQNVACTWDNAWKLLQIWGAFLIANQTTFLLTPTKS